MSSELDLFKLYSDRILALAAEIPHMERLDAPQATVQKRSPVCGSTVTVDLNLTDGRISEFGQDVKACVLGQAAAAVVGKHVIGRNRDEIARARDALRQMLTSDGPSPSAPFDELEILRAAQEFPNRHASILLTLDAISDAFAEAETTA